MKTLDLLFVLMISTSCAITDLTYKKLPHYDQRNREAFIPNIDKKLIGRNKPSKKVLAGIEAKKKEIKILQGYNATSDKPLFCHSGINAYCNLGCDNPAAYERVKDIAAKLNSDVVLINRFGSMQSGAVTTYGGGVAITQNTQTHIMQAFICDYSEVSLGVVYDNKTFKINYIRRNSLAEKIGLKENMQLLAINQKPVAGDPFIIQREINSRKPGDVVEIEYLDLKSTKIYKRVTLK